MKMNIKKISRNNRGFSLIELLISSTATLLIMGSIFTILVAYSQKSASDQSRVRQVQESRFLLNIMSSDLKNAGSVITLAHTGGFLRANPYINGFYPLNNTDFPDGIIIASGDPDAVSKLTATFTPTSGNDIFVDSVNDLNGDVMWAVGDVGIVLGTNGYYVFKVEAIPSTSDQLTKRDEAVYFSGLLDTDNYLDDHEGTTDVGEDIDFPEGAPVIRLSNFSIYMVRQQYDNDLRRQRRDVMRMVDAFGQADALNNKDVDIYVIAENIWDFQIGYLDYPDFPDITTKREFFMPNSTSLETMASLMISIQNRTIKEINMNIVALTNNLQGTGNPRALNVPAIGDMAAYTIPSSDMTFDFKLYQLTVDLRNLNISL